MLGVFLRVMSCAIVLLFMMIPQAAKSADEIIIYVDQAASGSANGQSWADAYTDLQVAIANADANSQIWVAKGTYRPSTSDPSVSFTLKNDVGIYGGFAGNETLLSQRDWQQNLTILSGDLANDDQDNGTDIITDTHNIGGTNSEHVIVTNGLTNTAVLDGFTITAGHNFYDGAGMWNVNSSPTLTNLHFAGNSADRGGGIFNDQSNPTLTNITFSYNHASSVGAGLFNTMSKPIIRNSRFYQNIANFGDGGGMANQANSDVTIEDVVFEENSAYYSGGGIANDHSSPTLYRVDFIRNIVGNHDGGGMFNSESSPIVDTARFIENTAGYGGGFSTSGGKPIVRNAQFINNMVMSRGGGAFNYGHTTEALFENVIFTANSAELNGGGLANQSNSKATVTNVVFAGNYASQGSALAIDEGGSTTLINATIAGNTTSQAGWADNTDGETIWNNDNSTFVGYNSIIWGQRLSILNDNSTAEFSSSLIEGCKPNGIWQASCGIEQNNSNLSDADPLFINPISYTAAPTTTADLRLQLGSPAINAGNNSHNSQTSDLDGNPRIVGVAIDLGAYEYLFAQLIAHAGNDQSVETGSLVTLDGSASSDLGGNLPLSYVWSQIAGPSVNLSDATSAQPTFIAPAQAATLIFELVVSNSYGVTSQPARVSITVSEPINPTQPHYQQYLPLTQHNN